MNTTQERIKRLFEILDEVALYRRTLGKLGFDRQCCAPKAGMEQAGEDAARLSQVVFRLTHSEEYFSLIEELYRDREALEPLQRKLVEYLYEDYEKTKNISPELSLEIDLAFEEAFTAWLEAKEQKDYSIFKPSFSKLIAYTRQMIDLRGERKGSYYDVCLDDYEKGGSIAQLDGFFNALKERILPLICRIKEHGKPIRDDFLTRPCAIAKQEAFSHELLAMEGLRTDALVLMTSEHPFTDNYGPNDVRVTTHYYEENFISNIFSTLHEGGHALFMQNEPKAFHDGFVSDRMTSAMHECMSRFYENIIGRSEEFIHAVYPKMQGICGDTFADVTERELYEAVNIATPGLSRMESDELCYCIHVLIRYELEKAFINGEITVDEIPTLWNQKYKDYLGVEPQNDAEGVLQDVHWSGSYGYFPSYALGSAYGAQMLHRMQQDFDVFATVREGNLQPVADWLIEHAFATASVMTPEEWMVHVTGEKFNVNYFLDYLEEKFTKLYQL